ncbi:MAG TPA: TetR/AcrR family transcriptional regulator [Brumimicrobium sp.]|nr:TetR/AcrR family transcriptional regulator [Brumimicrobium sp.]
MNIRQKELIIGGIHVVANQYFFELNERDVEQKSNTKRGALYESFSSKKDFIDACLNFILNELLQSNNQYLAINSDGKEVKETSRGLWFNSIAWWLGNPDKLVFYKKYLNSKYYIDNKALNTECRMSYFLVGQKAIDSGIFKPLPIEFLHELMIAQMLNTLNYLKKHPKLSADTNFLDLSFETLWDSLSVQ